MTAGQDEFSKAIWSLKKPLLWAAFFSMLLNIGQLIPALYMMQVSDRVLGSRNVDTLLWLTLIALFLYTITHVLEWVRHELMIAFSDRLHQQLEARVFQAGYTRSIERHGNFLPQVLQDLQTIRGFLTAESVFVLLDLPWLPLALVAIFMVQPIMGMFSLLTSLILLVITIAMERATHRGMGRSQHAYARASTLLNMLLTNAEVIEGMGMAHAIRQRWQPAHLASMDEQRRSSENTSVYTSLSKFIRLATQSLMLGVGVWISFEIDPSLSPGAMLVGSMLLGRALAPLDSMTMVWGQINTARMSLARIRDVLSEYPEKAETLRLPRPKALLKMENLVICAPHSNRIILRLQGTRILRAGECVQIKGPSGSGKTSLARVLVGAWKPHSGTVRLDGSDIHQWNRIELGPAIGYLPQSVDLMEGTLLENITRFADPDERALQEAIEATGLHEILDRLPQGLQTRIQPLSGMLSGGERQRVALARAIYGWPVLLVLDEPDANLDPQGKLHLLRVIEDMKRRGAIVLVITYTANDYPVDSVMDVVS